MNMTAAVYWQTPNTIDRVLSRRRS